MISFGDFLYKKILKVVKRNWIWILLFIIFIISLQLRMVTTNTKWLLAYDPYFQYRHTKDVVEDGVLSSWDEFSYYPPGRPLNEAPLLYYVTGYLYIILNPLLGISLMDFCKYMAAIYGAISIFPAYFLGKELSDKYAGALSSLFVGLSPAILTRTMGGFYDTDGMVIFFTLLTMYLLVRAFKRNKYLDYCLATFGLILFGLAWSAAWYIPLIYLLSIFTYFVVLLFIGNRDKRLKLTVPDSERIKNSFAEFKKMLIPFIAIFVSASVIIWALGYDAVGRILNLLIFAQNPAKALIVNISVAELQPLNVFGGAWDELFARIGMPFIFTIPGALLLLKRDRKNGALLLTWAGVSFYAITRGIRFMLVFAPAACISSAVAFAESYRDLKNAGEYAPFISFGFLASVILSLVRPSAGFLLSIIVVLILLVVNRKEEIPEISKPIFLATVLIVAIIVLSQGSQAALLRGMSEPVNKNWEDAYMWLKNNTAKDAVVGSWWDPGHRIAGIAERRNIADGAHCYDTDCKPGLNTRITHLGKIFVTSNETEAKEILLKYRGNASEMYWICSDDLIGKFRWLQYFGTGCDGTGELTPGGREKCPLYSQIFAKSYGYDQNYTIRVYYYDGISVYDDNGRWIAVAERNGVPYFFKKEITYINGTPKVFDFSGFNNTLPGTVWIHPDKKYIVFIPPTLENSLFTRMFFYEENETLKNFELVYKNDQVKIYKLII